MKSDLVDLRLQIYAETENAVLVSDDNGKTRFWLPKSQVEIDRRLERWAVITMPAWLAEDKRLEGAVEEK
jgi:hypothetical protein